MARGGQDFGSIVSVVGGNQLDTAEIQHILTGVGLLDGLGRSVFVDTFRHGMSAWIPGVTGAAMLPRLKNVIDRANAMIFNPPFAVEFNTGVVATHSSSLDRYVYIDGNYSLGVEVGFAVGEVTPTYTILLDHYIESDRVGESGVRINTTAGTIEFFEPGGFVSEFAFNNPANGFAYHLQCKFVVDFENGVYKKLLLGNRSYPVSTIPIKTGLAPAFSITSVSVGCRSNGAGTTPGYVGFVRLTQDEP